MSEEATSAIKSLGQRLSQSFPGFKTTLWQWKFDIVLLLSSAVCFGLFLERSINLDQMSGIGGPIAKLVRGNVEKKAAGTNLFIEIGPNTNLYNLDVIWVPKDNEASIQLEGTTTVKLAEKTLLILKRPFKHSPGMSLLEEQLKVVKGKVETQEGKTIVPETEVLTPVIPEESKSDKAVPIELYPKDTSTIYLRPEKDIPLRFAWPTTVSGYIAIQDKNNGHKIYAELINQRYFGAKLEGPGSYFWQIVDSDRRPIFGPYTFEIRHLDEEIAKKLLKAGTNDLTDIYW